jgi:hypothetical protein
MLQEHRVCVLLLLMLPSGLASSGNLCARLATQLTDSEAVKSAARG